MSVGIPLNPVYDTIEQLTKERDSLAAKLAAAQANSAIDPETGENVLEQCKRDLAAVSQLNKELEAKLANRTVPELEVAYSNIKALERKLAQVEADAAVMREAIGRCLAEFNFEESFLTRHGKITKQTLTDAINSGSGQALLDELAELRERTKHYGGLLQDIAVMRAELAQSRKVAQRRLELLHDMQWEYFPAEEVEGTLAPIMHKAYWLCRGCGCRTVQDQKPETCASTGCPLAAELHGKKGK